MCESRRCETCAFLDNDSCEYGLVGMSNCSLYMRQHSCYICKYQRNHQCVISDKRGDDTCGMFEIDIERWKRDGR